MASVARYCCCGGSPCSRCTGATPPSFSVTFSSCDLLTCGCMAIPTTSRYGTAKWNTGFSNATLNTSHTVTQSAADACIYEKTIANCLLREEYLSLANCNTGVTVKSQVFDLRIRLDWNAYSLTVESPIVDTTTRDNTFVFFATVFPGASFDCEAVSEGPINNATASCSMSFRSSISIPGGTATVVS